MRMLSEQPDTTSNARAYLHRDDAFVVDVSFDDARAFLGRCLATATEGEMTMMEWIASPIRWPDQQAKVEDITHLVSLMLVKPFYQRHLVFGEEVAGSLASLAVVCEYDSSAGDGWWARSSVKLRRRLLSAKLERSYQPSNSSRRAHEWRDMMTRSETVDSQHAAWRQRYGPSGLYWHVCFLAVDPNIKASSSFYSNLVRKVNTLADRQQVACHLETSSLDEKRRCEELGYAEVAHKTIENPIAKEEKKHSLHFYLLLRAPIHILAAHQRLRRAFG